MAGLPRSRARADIPAGVMAGLADAARCPLPERAGWVRIGRLLCAGSALTCGDAAAGCPSPAPAHATAGRERGAALNEYTPNLIEPVAWRARIRGAGRFVHADDPVITCIRFCLHAWTSWRTMDREAGTEGTAAPGSAGAGTCGGVMVRGPKSGNGTRSSVHYLDSVDLVSPRPQPRAQWLTPDTEMDPLAAGGAVTFDQISALHVPPGSTTRQITVTVIWELSEPPGSVAAGNQSVTAKLEMAYGMSVVDLQGGKWYVKGIGASSEAVGAR
jgi:hypothetical protein